MPSTQKELTAQLWTVFFKNRTVPLEAITVEDVDRLENLKEIAGYLAHGVGEPEPELPKRNAHFYQKSTITDCCAVCGQREKATIHLD